MALFPEGHRIGPYRIVRLLGEGGMGAVYEARQEPLERRVAIKTLRSDCASDHDAVARFFNEAKILSRLEHPSIVQVSDFGDAPDGTLYLVMEYLRGHSLRRRLRELSQQGERLPVVTALQLAYQIADVLAVAHAQGVVHRDLKPDNLMLVADPVAPSGERVKVLDFGIAKLTQPTEQSALKTDARALMGTPAYMSPEQCAGAGSVDEKSDIYSLGCVLYEALAGRRLFVADGVGRLIAMHLYEAPVPLAQLAPGLPVPVTELVHRLLSKDRAQRPSMSECADTLGKLLSQVSGAAPAVRSTVVQIQALDPAATRVTSAYVPSTTLGRSVGQSQLITRSRTPRAVLWAAASVAVGMLGGLWLLRARTAQPSLASDQTSAAPSAAAASGSKPEAAHLVTWRIVSEPAGAEVLDDQDAVLGTTPFSTVRRAELGLAVLRLRKRGYAEARITVYREHDAEQRLRLAPDPAPSAPSKSTSAVSARKRIGYED